MLTPCGEMATTGGGNATLNKIRVLIVDDSYLVCKALSEILSSDPQIEVMATAGDPITAANKIRDDVPDVMILDVEMPRMDGLTFLQMIMALKPLPVVMCSSHIEQGSKSAFKALEYGAVDIIHKPRLGVRQFIEESKIRICDAVKAAAMAKRKPVRPFPQLMEAEPKLTADVMIDKPLPSLQPHTREKVIVVGASTGGIEALRAFLQELPVNAPGIVIVQHLPEHFTRDFAARLDTLCRISVKEAENNDQVVSGRALIAPGNRHTLLKESGGTYFVEVKDGPLVSRHRPSVDVLFRSAARYAGKNAVGVIMTGMGDDGAAGMKEMKDAGAATIAQDEATCAVFGMPKEAIAHGGVDVVVPLERIAREVLHLCTV